MRFANALWIDDARFPASEAGQYVTTLWNDHGYREVQARLDVVVAVGPDATPVDFLGTKKRVWFQARESPGEGVFWEDATLEHVEHRGDGTCQLTFSPDRGNPCHAQELTEYQPPDSDSRDTGEDV